MAAGSARNVFRVLTTFFPRDPQSASQYRLVVRVGSNIVQPSSSTLDDCSPMNGRPLCTLTSTFAAGDVPADERVQLVLVRSMAGEVTARFDLRRVR